ncbi:hypothetical protein TELCIR_14485, partial [Teladorsagia circumcincta]
DCRRHAIMRTVQFIHSWDDSPFAAVAGKCQLSESQLDAYLRSEVRNGQRRKLLPRRNCSDIKLEDENTPRSDYRIPNSPPQSGSDSEGECSSVRKSGANNYQALAEKPQFSLKQVRMICERLLKEQEMRLRYEYELALNQKLDGYEMIIPITATYWEKSTNCDV